MPSVKNWKERRNLRHTSVIRCKYKNNCTRLGQCLYTYDRKLGVNVYCVIILKRHEGNKTKINNTRI